MLRWTFMQVRAKKRITIHEAPNVLTIQLKRFEFGGRGSKISRRVEFDFELDLSPFMSPPSPGTRRSGPPPIYDLYGVLVHHGHSLHSGHYLCYVRAASDIWHVCDDHRIAQVSQRAVEGQQAYILFYVRRHPKAPQVGRTLGAAAGSSGKADSQVKMNGHKLQHKPPTGAAAAMNGDDDEEEAGAADARRVQLHERRQSGAQAGPSGE